jgi:hypothetical protein
MGNRTATASEILKIGEALQRVCRKIDDTFCEYLDGNTDRAVATNLNVKASSVARVRREVYGDLRAAGGQFAARLTGLETSVKVLESELADVRKEYIRVIDLLNRALDAMSLEKAWPNARNQKIKPAEQYRNSAATLR